VKITAYKSIVRPILEYASPVWDPYQVGQINSVEMMQRKAARFCLNKFTKTESVTSMIQELSWNSLAHRRQASRLSMFSRVYNNEKSLCDLTPYITRSPHENLRHTHAYRLQSITNHKNVGHYSFLPRSIREWNALPRSILNEQIVADPVALRSAVLSHK
jgi:hypothetical protein